MDFQLRKIHSSETVSKDVSIAKVCTDRNSSAYIHYNLMLISTCNFRTFGIARLVLPIFYYMKLGLSAGILEDHLCSYQTKLEVLSQKELTV